MHMTLDTHMTMPALTPRPGCTRCTRHTRFLCATLLATLFALSACGGGGGVNNQGDTSQDSSLGTPPQTGTPDTSTTPDSRPLQEPSNPAPAASEPTADTDRSVLRSRGIEPPASADAMPYFSGRDTQPDHTLNSRLDEPGEVDDSPPTTSIIATAAAEATADTAAPAAAAATDPDAILSRLRARVALMSGTMDRHLRALFLTADGALVDTTLNFTHQSISFAPSASILSELVIPLAQGSSKQMMGFAFEHRSGLHGRGIVYGIDMLTAMADGSSEVQHRPLFKNAWRWALPAGALAASRVRHATFGHNSGTVNAYITRELGLSAEAVSCNLAAPVLPSSCESADVVVIGGGIDDNAAVRDRVVNNVKSLLSSGKSVMYFAPTTWNNYGTGTNALLGAMGETWVNYAGNFYRCPSSCVAVPASSFEKLRAELNIHLKWVDLLAMLAGTQPVPDVVSDRRPIQVIDEAHEALRQLQSSDISVLNQSGGRDVLRLLVAWADAWRPRVVYGRSVDKSVDRLAFLRAYASDSWIQYNRKTSIRPPDGAGDYMLAMAAREMRPGTEFEDIDVTIGQANGITLIGRAAVPGQAIEIEVIQPGSSHALAVQTSYLRAWGDPMSFNPDSPTTIHYKNPRRPGSWPVPLKLGQARYFVTPYGGPLMLTFNGATPGDVVKLRMRGAARYAHVDFTQATPVTSADIDDLAVRIQNDVTGWMTFKFTGGEVQQKIALARHNWARRSLESYVRHALQEDVFKVNHHANGYRNIPNSPTVTALCAEFSWDCTSDRHRPPGVQHFVGWIAYCGFLCSGQPVDAYVGVDSGWGFAHELGHNTVQRVHTISFSEADFDTGEVVNKGCHVECNNNILSVVTGLAVWERNRTVFSPGRAGTRALYVNVVRPSQDEAVRLGLTPEQARHMRGTRLWTNGSDVTRWSVHFQLAALFARYRHPDSPKVTHEMMYDFLRLLTMGDRLVSSDWSTAHAARYAMGRYPNNSIGNHELVYTLGSKIIGRDLRQIFALYGIPLSSTALGSVADLGLPVAPMSFYAFPEYSPTEGVWIELDPDASQWPPYPFSS